jgi:hypothetical protein
VLLSELPDFLVHMDKLRREREWGRRERYLYNDVIEP